MARQALATAAGLGLLATACAWAQYPGQVAKPDKDQPTLRAVSVIEWTGDFGAPKAARMVPVVVVEGDQLHDGGSYLSRPQPLSLGAEVEYELQQNGKMVGLFDIQGAAQERGVWIGYGRWKKPPAPKSKRDQMAEMAKLDMNDDSSDRPVLHRKHHAKDKKSGAESGSAAKPDAGAADPDRPTLHKKDSSAESDSKSSNSTGSAKASEADEAPDTDRPTLRRHGSGGESATDADRPKVKKNKKRDEDVGRTDAVAGLTDPDRPRLKRGKADADVIEIKSSLVGMPSELSQAVAVSDLRTRPVHEWSYHWANPEDEKKTKAAMEDLARDALGLKPPPAAPPAPAPEAKKSARKKVAKPVVAPEREAVEPAPLEEEQFRVFELAYGSGATLVLSARSSGAADERKYVTLVARLDFYGNVQVLLKSTTDTEHLDERPRMRLIDAVDALADNRGELLFEMRGATGRQFALYRVMRGTAEQIFLGAGGEYGGGGN